MQHQSLAERIADYAGKGALVGALTFNITSRLSAKPNFFNAGVVNVHLLQKVAYKSGLPLVLGGWGTWVGDFSGFGKDVRNQEKGSQLFTEHWRNGLPVTGRNALIGLGIGLTASSLVPEILSRAVPMTMGAAGGAIVGTVWAVATYAVDYGQQAALQEIGSGALVQAAALSMGSLSNTVGQLGTTVKNTVTDIGASLQKKLLPDSESSRSFPQAIKPEMKSLSALH